MTNVISRASSALRSATVLALFERLVNRGASALVTFGMALFVSPAAAGAYAFGMLALTLAQAVGESALRQTGVTAWRYADGGAQLRSISRWVAAGGAALVLVAVTIGFAVGLYGLGEYLALLPLVAVGFVQGIFAPNITRAQHHGQWGGLSREQSIGAAVSLVVAAPLLPFIGIAAGVLQTVISETFFAVRAGRGLDDPRPDRGHVDVLRGFVLPTAISNLFGWVSGQAERLVVTIVAGAGPLGLLSLALAVARTATDAVLSGLLNVLRSRLAAAADAEERAATLTGLMLRSVAVAGALQVIVTLLSIWPLREILAPEWLPALAAVPLLAISGVSRAAHYSISSAVIDAGRARSLRTINVVSLVFALVVGLTLSYSLPIGALAAAVSDVLALIIMLPLVRTELTRRTGWWLVVSNTASFAFGGALFWIQAGL